MIYFLMFFLAFWAGFSVRRASLCLVRATLEIIKRKPPKALFFILQATAVALSITIPARIFFPDEILVTPSYGISWYLFIGAALYGVGASLNGSCALGTLNQLISGKIVFLGTIIGMMIGFFGFLQIQNAVTLQKLDTTSMSGNHVYYLVPLMFLVWGISFFRIKKFLMENEGRKLIKLKQYIKSSVARDFIGTSIFGFCSGTLFLLLGSSWDYTQFIQFIEFNIFNKSMFDSKIIPLLITTLALIMGVSLASIISKDIKFKNDNVGAYVRKIFAGILMGFSVGLIPGGNDTLILYGLPGLAFHAPIALFIMMSVIAMLSYTTDKISHLSASLSNKR